MAHCGNSASGSAKSQRGTLVFRAGAQELQLPGSRRSGSMVTQRGRRTSLGDQAVAVQTRRALPASRASCCACCRRRIEEVDVDGFIFVKRPDASTDLGRWRVGALAPTIFPDGQRYQWFHRAGFAFHTGNARKSTGMTRRSNDSLAPPWLALNAYTHDLLFCRFQGNGAWISHSARRNHLRMP